MIKINEETDKIFVTADTHFDHKNIIKYCNRPFSSVEEMDEKLIDNWNKIVGKDDIIYHLGDFTLGGIKDAKRYFSQLNGKIKVLSNPWHHDKRWMSQKYFGPMAMEYPDIAKDIHHVNILPPMVVLEIKGMGPLPITLCHYPLEVWDRKHYRALHLYGHTHKPDTSGLFRLNVGIDCMNYCPVSLNEVFYCMHELGW